MTLAIAWIRKIDDQEELVVASDSRLTGGGAWDACPKTFALPSDDAVIAFCGDTTDAYPYILQLRTAIAHHRASMERSLSLTRSKDYYLDVLKQMRLEKERVDGRAARGEARFLIAGYCWRSNAFKTWQYRYDDTQQRYILARAAGLRGLAGKKHVTVIGDPNVTQAEAARRRRAGKDPRLDQDVQREYYDRLISLIRARELEDVPGLDMEPFEVLVDMIRTNASQYVGGPPQLVKVYRSSTVQNFGVTCPWLAKGSQRSFMGRPLMKSERFEVPFINAVTLKISRPMDTAES